MDEHILFDEMTEESETELCDGKGDDDDDDVQ